MDLCVGFFVEEGSYYHDYYYYNRSRHILLLLPFRPYTTSRTSKYYYC